MERDPDNGNRPGDARNRIGSGPWFNANGAMVANNLSELHSRRGDAALFLDERGQRINGQWTGSPAPNQHDILTGSTADGVLMPGMTCADWTSDSASAVGQVGHSDGFGPNQDTSGALSSWNSAHANQNCTILPPRRRGALLLLRAVTRSFHMYVAARAARGSANTKLGAAKPSPASSVIDGRSARFVSRGGGRLRVCVLSLIAPPSTVGRPTAFSRLPSGFSATRARPESCGL